MNNINEILLSNDGEKLCESVMNKFYECKNYSKAIKAQCDELRETKIEKNILLAEIYEILLEADAQFMNIQFFVLSHLIVHPSVQTWGYKNIENWENLNDNKKLEVVSNRLMTSGGYEEARKYMHNSDNVSMVTQNVFDIHDIDEPYTGIKSEHLKQLKDSQVFKDLLDIFLKHFKI